MKTQLTIGISLGTLLAACLYMTPAVFSRGAAGGAGGIGGRTPIDSLPFIIDTCGSYYVDGCLTGVPGQHGIEVLADDVTIDLNGFTLTGVPGSFDGIHSTGDRLRVHDGFITGWGEDGIESTRFVNHFERLNLRGNGANGITCGRRSIVRRCMALANGGHGIVADQMALVERCISSDNGQAGFCVDGSNGIAKHNISARNDYGFDMTTGIGWIFKENSVVLNGAHGMRVAQDNLVKSNVSYGNGVFGIGAGVQTGTGSYVVGNVLCYNDYGVNAPQNQPTPDVMTLNCAVGNSAANYTGFAGDDFGPIGSASSSSSPWSNISQ